MSIHKMTLLKHSLMYIVKCMCFIVILMFEISDLYCFVCYFILIVNKAIFENLTHQSILTAPHTVCYYYELTHTHTHDHTCKFIQIPKLCTNLLQHQCQFTLLLM